MNYKVRCSKLGTLFSSCGKSKYKLEWDLDKIKNHFTATHMKLAIEIYNKKVNGFEPVEKLTYDMQNGNELEPEAFKLIKFLKGEEYNEQEYSENDIITGTRDLGNNIITIDNKTSTDRNVFDLKKFEELELDYIFQLNGYKKLFKSKEIIIANTLITPSDAYISDMATKVKWIKKMSEIEFEKYRDKLQLSYEYDHIPIKDRVSFREVPIIENFEEMLEYRVTKLNTWIKENLEQ